MNLKAESKPYWEHWYPDYPDWDAIDFMIAEKTTYVVYFNADDDGREFETHADALKFARECCD